MKKFVSLILALVLFIVGFAFAEDSKAERVYVRGEIREMLDMTALAQSAPGPIAVNAAIQVGWKVGGLTGMLLVLFLLIVGNADGA